MLGLQVNTYVAARDHDDARHHRVMASKMDIHDIADILSPVAVAPIAVREEGMPDLEQDSDGEAGPSSPREAPVAQEEAAPDPTAPLYILGADEEEAHAVNNAPFFEPHPRPSPYGTPTSRVGLPSTARSPVEEERQQERAAPVEPAAEGGCTASSGGEECELPLPPLRGEDMLQALQRPRVEQYRADRRTRNKRPYVEYPRGEVLELSDEDEDEAMLHKPGAGLPSSSGEKSKQDPITVEAIDAQIAKRMEEQLERRLREANEMNAARILSLQETMERERREAAQRHADLMHQNQQFMMTMMAAMQAMPHAAAAFAPPAPAFPMATTQMAAPPSSSHAVYIAEHAHPSAAPVTFPVSAPVPVPVASPVPVPVSVSIPDPVSASSSGLRPCGRNSPEPASIPSPSQQATTHSREPAAAPATTEVAAEDAPHGVDEPMESPAHTAASEEDSHMRGSQDSEEMEHDIQAAQSSPHATFTDARPQPEPMATSPVRESTPAAELTADEVINL